MARESHRPTKTNYQDYLFDFSNVDFSQYAGQDSARGADVAAQQTDEPGFLSRLGNTALAIGEGLTMLPGGIVDTVRDTWHGGDIDVTDTEAMREREERARQQAAYVQKYQGKAFDGVADAMISMPYSLATMGASLGAGIPATMAAGPVVGGATGMAASGAVAYRASKQNFMENMLAETTKLLGRTPTQDEWDRVAQEFDSEATQYGLWEAGPEALSNLFMAKLLGPLGKRVFSGGIGNAAKRVAGLYGEEMATETITQMGQGSIEADLGLRDEAPGVLQALGEVAPATFWQTTLMAGGKKGLDLLSRRYGRGQQVEEAPAPDQQEGSQTRPEAPAAGQNNTAPATDAPKPDPAFIPGDPFTDPAAAQDTEDFVRRFEETEQAAGEDTAGLARSLDQGKTVDLLAPPPQQEDRPAPGLPSAPVKSAPAVHAPAPGPDVPRQTSPLLSPRGNDGIHAQPNQQGMAAPAFPVEPSPLPAGGVLSQMGQAGPQRQPPVTAVPTQAQVLNIQATPRADTTAPAEALGMPAPDAIPREAQPAPQAVTVPAPSSMLQQSAPVSVPRQDPSPATIAPQAEAAVDTSSDGAGISRLSRAELLRLLPDGKRAEARRMPTEKIRRLVGQQQKNAAEGSLAASPSVIPSTETATMEENDGQERSGGLELGDGGPSAGAAAGDAVRTGRGGAGQEAAQSSEEREGKGRGGRRTSVKIPNHREEAATYRLMEVDDIQPSHLPESSFQKNPEYGLENERRYHDEPASRKKVLDNAADLDPAFLLESVDANHGAPVIDRQGNVLGGNGRSMSVRYAYDKFPDRAQAYRQALRDKAESLGLSPEEVDAMRRPILVRELDHDYDAAARQQLVSALNDTFTDSKNARASGKSRGDRFSEKTLEALAGGLADADSLRQYFDTPESARVVELMIKDGVIRSTERNAYLDADGLLNPDGKRVVEEALRGRIARSYDALASLPGPVLARLDAAIPNLMIAEGISPEWDITDHIRDAVDLLAEHKASGITSPEVFLDQVDMLKGKAPKERYSHAAQQLFKMALGMKKNEFAKAFEKYAAQAKISTEAGGFPGVGMRPDVAQHEFFGIKRQSPAEAETEAAQQDGTKQQQQEADDVEQHPGGNLERDSGNGSTQDRVGKETLSDDGTGNGSGGRERSGRAGKELATAGGTGIPGHEALASGEGSSAEVDEGTPGIRRSPAGSEQSGRSRGDGGNGLDVRRDGKEATAATAERGDGAVGDDAHLRTVRRALPKLYPGQQEDVVFAERRFRNGQGVMFTNGTGTGKTGLGLGIIKRLVDAGRKNILIAVPADKIGTDWGKLGDQLGVETSKLADTRDAGKGVTITTHANMAQNDALFSRDWDLIVIDEAHKLSSGKSGDSTALLEHLRGLAMHPRGVSVRAERTGPGIELMRKMALLQQKRKAGKELTPNEEAREAELSRKFREWQEEVERAVLKARSANRADLANGKEGMPGVLLLSATPFAYEKSIDYAEGFLFDYPERQRSGYNEPDGREAFMIEHFGYRMRYGKLTQPEADVDSGLMQRNFNSWLKRQGVLSSRNLDTPFDYDRRFVLAENAVGQKIDEGLDFLRENHARYGELHEYLNKDFDHLARRYLLEAIKAREAVSLIREHRRLGRKIVVFHQFNRGGGFHPFDVSGITPEMGADLYRQAQTFAAERPDLVNLPLKDLASPVETLKKAFPDARIFSGLVSKKEREAAVADFQRDEGGADIIIVQADAGEAGLSLHDTTGKHQRVLINLGLPTKPVTAIQQEGRIFRAGQRSNALFRYLNTGTNWERAAFAQTIAQRASAAENLAMGEEARGLKDAFIQAFEDSGPADVGVDGEGTGGKARDRSLQTAVSEFDRAKSLYFAQQKKTSRTRAREGNDYFATPEPLGQKMVEWARIEPGHDVLEPSAGHGAIARWFPESARRTVVEPSAELASRLMLATDAKVRQHTFEDLDIVNKYDRIVMNPPFGAGGKTAMQHLEKAFRHLRAGGRIVAIVPDGPSMNKRLAGFFAPDEKAQIVPVLRQEISLPDVTFSRAGTQVKCKVLIMDAVRRTQFERSTPPPPVRRNIEAENIRELFDKLEDMPGTSTGNQTLASLASRPARRPDSLPSRFADMPTIEADSTQWFGPGKAIDANPFTETPEQAKTLREAVKAWARERFPNGTTATNVDTGWDVQITPKGVRDSLSHGFDALLARSVPFIPQIVESGIHLDSIEKKPGLISHIFANKIRLDGQDYVVGFVLREDGNGNRFYDHELTKIISSDQLVPGKQREATAELRTDQNLPPSSSELLMNRGDVMNILRERLGVNDGTGQVLFRVAGQFLPPKFKGRRAPSTEAVRRLADKMNSMAANAARVEIVENAGALPQNLRDAYASQADSVEGLYDPTTDTVWLVVENLESLERAAEVWLHENIVHHGLRSALAPAQRRLLLNQLWQIMGGMGNSSIRDIANRYGRDPRSNEADRLLIMEEALANLAERRARGMLRSTQEQSLWRRVVDAIVRAWNGMVHTLTGRRGRMGRSQMERLLDALQGHVMDGRPVAMPDAALEERTDSAGAFASLSADQQEAARAAWMQLQTDMEAWGRQLDDIADGHGNKISGLTIGATPDVLQRLGAKPLPMEITRHNLTKVLTKHDIPLDTLRDLPKHLANPIMVFKSATMSNAYVMLTEMERNGENLVAAIHFDVDRGRTRVNDIASIHDRSTRRDTGKTVPGWVWAKNQIAAGNLRYYDKTRSSRWFRERAGLQLSSVVNRESYRGIKILTEKDVVKPADPGRGGENTPLASLASRPSGLAESVASGIRALRKVMGRGVGADVEDVLSNREMGNLIPRHDLSLAERLFKLPHWVAKDHAGFAKVYDRQLRRVEERSAALKATLEQVPLLFDGDASKRLGQKEQEQLAAMIWKWDGKQIGPLNAIEKFNVVDQTVNGRDVLELNPDYQKKFRAWLKEQPESERVKQAFGQVREALDAAFLRAYNKMAAMSDLADTDLEMYRTEFGNIHNYFPHQRTGKYFVVAKVGKETVFRKHFDVPFGSSVREEWAKIVAEHRKDFPDATWEDPREAQKLPDDILGAPIDPEAMEQIISAAASRLGDSEQAERVRSTLLSGVADVLKARGFGAHGIHRQNIPGFETQDVKGVLYSYMAGLNGWLTKMEAAADFARALGKIDASASPRLWEYAAQYTKDMLRNSDQIDRITGNIKSVAFAWYLGGNIKTAVVNLTQNAVVGVPRLQQYVTGGGGHWLKSAMDTIGLTYSGKGLHGAKKLTAEEAAMLQELYGNSVITDAYMEEVRGQISASPSLRMWERFTRLLGWPMSKVEIFNRASLALAAYRAARVGAFKTKALKEYGLEPGQKMSPEQARDFAATLVRDTHFEYGRGNQPEFLRSNVAGRMLSPVFTFRSFGANILNLWWRALLYEGKEGRTFVAKSLGATVALGGLTAFPFYATLAALCAAASGDDEDWTAKIRNALPENNLLRDVACYGLPSLLGVNIGGSLRMETPFTEGMKRGETFKEAMTESLGDLLGIPYDLAVNKPSKFLEARRFGADYRAVEALVPTFVANIMQAWRLTTEGQTTMHGRPINSPGQPGARKLSTGEAFGKALGFQPTSSTKSYEAYAAEKRRTSMRSDRIDDFTNQALDDLESKGRPYMMRELQEKLQTWNKEMEAEGKPAMKIMPKDVLRRVAARRRENRPTRDQREKGAAQMATWGV